MLYNMWNSTQGDESINERTEMDRRWGTICC